MNIYKIRKNIKFNQSVNNFSQFNEDLYLAKIFEGSASGVCVDVGANDGVYGSNSALLEQLGWSCILVEPNISLYESILKNRRPYKLFQCVASDVEGEANLYVVSGGELAHGLSTMVPSLENIERIKDNNFEYKEILVNSRTLDSMLFESGVSKVDVLSIDVEGHELAVIRGFTIDKWHPRIFIIEDNSNYQSNDIAIYLRCEGYLPFFRTGVNDWYAKRSDMELINFSNVMNYQFEKVIFLTKKLHLILFFRKIFLKLRIIFKRIS